MQDNIDFVNFNWRQDYAKFVDYLRSLIKVGLDKFSASLTPTKYTILGVPIPQLRVVAKNIAKGDIEGFVEAVQKDTFEEVMLWGMVISFAKISREQRVLYLTTWSDYIDNWALTDCVGACLKSVKNEQQYYLKFINDLLVSNQNFKIRLAIILLMDYYLTDEYIDFVVDTITKIDDNNYYVSMAIAWLVSVLFVKFRNKALKLLQSKTLSAQTQNKAIQKIRDSLRVSKEDKDLVTKYKK